MSELHWLDHLLIFILVLGLPLNSFVQGKQQFLNRVNWSSGDKIKFYWTNAAALWMLFAAVVLNWWITGKELGRQEKLMKQIMHNMNGNINFITTH